MQLNAIHSCNESLQKTVNNSGTRSLPIIRVWFVRFHNINFDARMQHVQKPLHVFIKGLQMYNEYIFFFQIATLCLTKFIANSQRMPDTYTVLCLLIKKNDPEINPSDCSALFLYILFEIHDSVPRYFMSKFSCLFDISLNQNGMNEIFGKKSRKMHGNCQNNSKFLLKHSGVEPSVLNHLTLWIWTKSFMLLDVKILNLLNICQKSMKSCNVWLFRKLTILQNEEDLKTIFPNEELPKNWFLENVVWISNRTDNESRLYQTKTTKQLNPVISNRKSTLETLVSPNLPNSLNIFFGIPTKNPINIPGIIRILCFLSQLKARLKDFIIKKHRQN